MEFDPEKVLLEMAEADLEVRRKLRHKECAAVVVQWLTLTARKRIGPDLPEKLKVMTKAIYALTETMKLKIIKGELVVKAEGSAEQTLTQLLLGTKWFEPDVNVVAQIYSGLFTGP